MGYAIRAATAALAAMTLAGAAQTSAAQTSNAQTRNVRTSAIQAGPDARPGAHAQSRKPEAASAERHGTPSSAREGGVGYDARSRRMADCLASFRRYDPATDRIRIRPGVSQPCPLPRR
jgi:hypothetical protein